MIRNFLLNLPHLQFFFSKNHSQCQTRNNYFTWSTCIRRNFGFNATFFMREFYSFIFSVSNTTCQPDASTFCYVYISTSSTEYNDERDIIIIIIIIIKA